MRWKPLLFLLLLLVVPGCLKVGCQQVPITEEKCDVVPYTTTECKDVQTFDRQCSEKPVTVQAELEDSWVECETGDCWEWSTVCVDWDLYGNCVEYADYCSWGLCDKTKAVMVVKISNLDEVATNATVYGYFHTPFGVKEAGSKKVELGPGSVEYVELVTYFPGDVYDFYWDNITASFNVTKGTKEVCELVPATKRECEEVERLKRVCENVTTYKEECLFG